MKRNLAYIDDSSQNLDCIGLIMQDQFSVATFTDPDLFLADYPNSNYQVILVDIHMPKMDGFLLYEKIIEHPHYNGCPIIFISSDDSDTNRIKSFSLGAVDFLNRQMSPTEMVTRVNSKIMFFEKHRSVIEFENLKVNLTLLKAYLNGNELKLTFIEFKLLCHSLRNYPDLISKEALIEYVWSSGHVLDATVYTHISNLNSKLTAWTHEVEMVRNKGLRLSKRTDF
jgi:two-component system, OmpR family, response regulator